MIERKLETPLIETPYSPEQKYERIQGLLTEVMATLGLDLNDDSLCQTPHRIAKMYVNEIFSGLDYQNLPKMGVDEMIDFVNYLVNSDYIRGRTLHIDGGRHLA